MGRSAQKLGEVLRRWKEIPPTEMCLVGDTIFDVEGANLVGMPSVGVSFGFGDVNEMKEAGAFAICDSMQEIPEVIEKI